MLLENSNMAFVFNSIEDLKKRFYNNNTILQNDFNEATVLPIPDDAPFEVPRIILTSKNEYSQLIIYKNSVTFQTEFSEDFQNDWSKCINYLQSKLEVINTFIENLTGGNYDYFGLIVEGNINDDRKDGSYYISQKLLRNHPDSMEPYDIQLRYTFKSGEDIFINVGVRNQRIFSNHSNVMKSGTMNEKYEIGNTIGISIDVNDRLGFNTIDGYKTDRSKISKIMDIMKDNIEWKIDAFIKEGVYKNEG